MKPPTRLAGLRSREEIASTPRHWVRLGAACNNRCVFCLDGEQDRDLLVSLDGIQADLACGRTRGASRVILSGGEASVHPSFVEVIRRARALGYTWVQTISNGIRFADPRFLLSCIEAGLSEVTFSVHGHTPALHDRLTGHPGAFKAIVTAIARAVRSGRLVVSVDVLLCRENIRSLDRIIELCLGLGVREYDLLQVIPQGRAFTNRDEMLYEPAEHIEALHRVLKLSRHPGITVWTNRLPARYLEGFEDLIQDPHKLHDEVRGREREMRSWLDAGTPLPCRQPERCRSCFLEPFCAFVDGVVARLRDSRFEVLDVGDASPSRWERREGLPFGCSRLDVTVEDPAEWWHRRPIGVSALTLRSDRPIDPHKLGPSAVPVTITPRSPEQLEACITTDGLPRGVTLEIELRDDTAAWLSRHRTRVARVLGMIRLHQPGPDSMAGSTVAPTNPRRLLEAVGLPVGVSGLPRCVVGGATARNRPATLELGLFDPATGRLALAPLVASFIRDGYLVKSLRCAACAWTATCDGLHVNLCRMLGLGLLTPLPGQAPTGAHGPAALPGGGVGWDPSGPAHAAPRLEGI